MILFVILIVVAGLLVLGIRRQSHFQHREMMRAINPEYMARIEAEERARANKVVKIYLIILGIFGLLFLLAFCQQFKGFGRFDFRKIEPAKIQSPTP